MQPLEESNLMFYTSIATSGSGRAVVIATGDKTVMGQIAGLAMETGAGQAERYDTSAAVPVRCDVLPARGRPRGGQ